MIKFLSVAIFVLSLFCPCNPYAANYSLEIIQPIAGLNTSNRFYKAYPGLEYNVRMAVIGGVYPFTYSLTTAPSGMTINASTGVITWASPTATGSPHSVTAVVTDAENSTDTVSWTVTVTTSGFIFIDAVDGLTVAGGGTGTIANPYKTIADWYGQIDTFSNYFIYYKEGSYFVSSAWLDLAANRYPSVWLAYPGETPEINMSNDNSILFYSGGSNVYLDGITFNIDSNVGVNVTGDRENVVVRRCIFDYGSNTGVVGSNSSMIFINRPDLGTESEHYAFQENIGRNALGTTYWLLGYSAGKVLVENNILSNIDGHAIGPKEGTDMWFIRGNKITESDGDGIGLQYSDTGGIDSGNIEISYNYISMAEGARSAIFLNANNTSDGNAVYTFRNTVVGPIEINLVTTTNGPWYINNNVIQNEVAGDGITTYSIEAPARLIIENNLHASSDLVDSFGELLPAQAAYVGVNGWQLADGSTPIDGTYTPPAGDKTITFSGSTTGTIQ